MVHQRSIGGTAAATFLCLFYSILILPRAPLTQSFLVPSPTTALPVFCPLSSHSSLPSCQHFHQQHNALFSIRTISPTTGLARTSLNILTSLNKLARQTRLYMAKTKSKSTKKKKTSSSSSGLNGFGSASSSSHTGSFSNNGGGIIDRSKSALKFYNYLEHNGAGINLKRVGLGQFPLHLSNQATPPTGDDVENSPPIMLRGVIALRDIPKGEPIIEIPYEMALDLGRENADPTLPGMDLLHRYCRWLDKDSNNGSGSEARGRDDGRGDYFAMLPPYLSSDSLGSTDFFSEKALEMMQSPLVVEETLSRRELVKKRYERDVQTMAMMSANLYRWSDGNTETGNDNRVDSEENGVATESHLQWATWLVTSRVLTVQGTPADDDGMASSSTTAHRLLIPLIDMCNHDRNSPHILSGRAVPGGMLKVVAGRDVEAGEAVNIGYGGNVEGNDRFIQDYGFLDTGGSEEYEKWERGGTSGGVKEEFVPEAYQIAARKLVGQTPRSLPIKKLLVGDQQRALKALGATLLEEDEALLKSGEVVKQDEKMALEYRIGIKKALKVLNSS